MGTGTGGAAVTGAVHYFEAEQLLGHAASMLAPGVGPANCAELGHCRAFIVVMAPQTRCSRMPRWPGSALHEGPAAWHGLDQAFLDQNVDGAAYRADR
jgi:hypothetical protein